LLYWQRAGIYLLKKDEQKEKEAIYASEPIEEAAAIPVSDSRESHLVLRYSEGN
jgi:hypothetical protein